MCLIPLRILLGIVLFVTCYGACYVISRNCEYEFPSWPSRLGCDGFVPIYQGVYPWDVPGGKGPVKRACPWAASWGLSGAMLYWELGTDLQAER